MQVQKVTRWFVAIGFLAAIIWLGVGLVSRHWDAVFQKLYRCPLIGIVITYNFPPEDYYVPRVSLPLQEGEMSAPLTCKYEGSYEVNIVNFKTYNCEQFDMRICVSISDGLGHLVYTNVQSKAETLTGYTRDGVWRPRLCYGIFECPEDVPTGRLLTVKIVGEDGVEAFVRKNPHAMIVVKKTFN